MISKKIFKFITHTNVSLFGTIVQQYQSLKYTIDIASF